MSEKGTTGIEAGLIARAAADLSAIGDVSCERAP